MKLSQETKARVLDVFDQVRHHSNAHQCKECSLKLTTGFGDLCEMGHSIACEILQYANTCPEFDDE